MNLNDLLRAKSIDPEQVLVFRHRPFEPELNNVLPWLASKKPDIFNAYQQTQGPKVEKAMLSTAYVASFIGREPGKAVFVGLYSIGASKPLTLTEYWQVPAHIEMKAFGMKGFRGEDEGSSSVLWFDLELKDFYASWKGKLIVHWPRRSGHGGVGRITTICLSLLCSKIARLTPPCRRGMKSRSHGKS